MQDFNGGKILQFHASYVILDVNNIRFYADIRYS